MIYWRKKVKRKTRTTSLLWHNLEQLQGVKKGMEEAKHAGILWNCNRAWENTRVLSVLCEFKTEDIQQFICPEFPLVTLICLEFRPRRKMEPMDYPSLVWKRPLNPKYSALCIILIYAAYLNLVLHNRDLWNKYCVWRRQSVVFMFDLLFVAELRLSSFLFCKPIESNHNHLF